MGLESEELDGRDGRKSRTDMPSLGCRCKIASTLNSQREGNTPLLEGISLCERGTVCRFASSRLGYRNVGAVPWHEPHIDKQLYRHL